MLIALIILSVALLWSWVWALERRIKALNQKVTEFTTSFAKMYNNNLYELVRLYNDNFTKIDTHYGKLTEDIARLKVSVLAGPPVDWDRTRKGD